MGGSMMNRMLLLALAFTSFGASAIDMDYYTVGQADTLELTFKSVALFFNHSVVRTMMIIAMVAGLGFGLIQSGFAGFAQKLDGGDGTVKLSTAFWSLLGMAFFAGLFLPTATLHIYDSARNQYKPVTNVPQMIVFAAGITNNIEREFNDVANASKPNLYSTNSSGLPFQLLYFVGSEEVTRKSSPYLKANIASFYKNCVVMANIDKDELYNSSVDAWATLVDAAKPGWWATWYDSTSTNGNPIDCQTMYNQINTETNSTSDSVQEQLKGTCSLASFDVSNAVELTACKRILDEALSENLGITTGYAEMFRTSILAESIHNSLANQSTLVATNMLTNRGMVQDGMSSLVGATSWMPVIKAALLSVVVAATIIIAFLFPTPLFPKAFKLLIGLWAFVFFWNVTDILMVQLVNANAKLAFDGIKDFNQGLTTFYLLPSAAQKALIMMSEARQSSMQMALIFTATFTGVSAYGLMSMGQGLTGSMSKNSDKAANDVAPESKGQMMENLTNSTALERVHNQYDFGSMSNSQQYAQQSNLESNVKTIGHYGGDVNTASSASGQAGAQGSIQSNSKAAAINSDGNGMAISAQSGDSEGHTIKGKAEATKELAEQHGTTTSQIAYTQGEVAGGSSTGEAYARLNESSRTGISVAQQSSDESSILVAQTLGAIDAKRENAEENDTNIEDQAFTNSAFNTMMEQANIDVDKEVIDTIRKDNPNATNGELMQTLAEFQKSNTIAEVDAHDGDSSSIIDDKTYQSKATHIETDTEQRTLDEQGVTQAEYIEKSTESLVGDKLGRIDALEIDANQNGGDIVDVARDMSSHSTKEQLAQQQAFDDLVSSYQTSNPNASVQDTYDALADMDLMDKRALLESHGYDTSAVMLDKQDTADHDAGHKEGARNSDVITGESPRERGVQSGITDAAKTSADIDAVGDKAKELNTTPDDVIHKKAESDATKNTEQGMLLHELADTMPEVSFEDLAKADVGANNHIALDGKLAAAMHAAGHISDEQYEVAKDGGRIDFSLGRDENNNLETVTSNVATGDSATSNDQISQVEGSSYTSGLQISNPSTARDLVTNADKVENVLSRGEEGERDLALALNTATQGLYSADDQTSSSTNLGISGVLGFGDTTSQGGKGFGNASVNAGAEERNTSLQTTDRIVGTALEVIEIAQNRADNLGLSGESKEEFVAEQFSKYSSNFLEQASDLTEANAKGYNNLANEAKHDFVKDMNAEYPHQPDNVETPETIKSGDKEELDARTAAALATLEHDTNVVQRLDEGWQKFGSDLGLIKDEDPKADVAPQAEAPKTEAPQAIASQPE
ncbi:conjugal transfer protein TraG, partial [Vibrio tasmaniensis]